MYIQKTTPFSHQQFHLDNHARKPAWGLLWEQGTAKTKPIIDTAGMLFSEGEINGLLVVAPPGVERNWATDELPKHMPDALYEQTYVGVFQTKRKGTKDHKARMRACVEHGGLSVLLISYPAFRTKDGKKAVWDFLRKRKCLYVLDEAHNIKTPKAKTTQAIIKSGVYAPYKRILTGTPIANSAFDIYSQVRFIDPNFWKSKGIPTFQAFKHRFGNWLTAQEVRSQRGYDPGYDKLLSYRDLDVLHEWLKQITDRYLKEDVLDLPPKLYTKRYLELSKQQQVIYEQLKTEFYYQHPDGVVVDAELPIVLLLRFQQVLCGYLPAEPGEPLRIIDEDNPRLKAMEEIRDTVNHSAIIWARFRKDIDQLMELFPDAVRYDGSVDEDQAQKNRQAFQAGDVQWFIGTAAKGGPGLTLHRAKTVIYYSNSFKLVDRLQSEDRAHRAGMDDNHVDYIDLCVPDTVDERIIDNLRAKVDIASAVTGDNIKEWI